MKERLINLMQNQKEEIVPLLTRVLVKVDKVEKKTDGGIVIPDEILDRETVSLESGIVEWVGMNAFQGWGDGSHQVERGDHVYFLRHAGQIRKIDDEDYRLLNDQDLLAISKADYEKKQQIAKEEKTNA